MKLNPRQTAILDYIKENRHARVSALSKIFFVSEMTVRRDLCELEKLNCIRRFNGGAVINEKDFGLPLESRTLHNAEEKKALCRKAASAVKDGMTLFVDHSATCSFLPVFLRERKNIRIVTNSLRLPTETHLPCFVVGGNYYEKDMCLFGPKTIASLGEYHADIGFYSAMGLSGDGVISDESENACEVRRAMMAHCDRNVFLFDSSKLGKLFSFIISDGKNVTTLTRDTAGSFLIV